MLPGKNENSEPGEDKKMPSANTGNASNPSPGSQEPEGRQLFPEKAEKYLRESGNIEDMPDAEEEDSPRK